MDFSTITVKGFGRGKTFGFPTINMQIPPDFSLDRKEGIYSAIVGISGNKYVGALYYGDIPVFKHEGKVLEVFLLGIEDIDIVEGTSIEFDVKDYIRGVMNFDSKEELVNQIKKDVEIIRNTVKI